MLADACGNDEYDVGEVKAAADLGRGFERGFREMVRV